MDPQVMKTLIVDDEPIARRVLREELAAYPQVDVIGEAENGKQALQRISELRPDLVFLDLQMPLMGGFEVVRNLGHDHIPVVVIVTAYDAHAIQAFDAGAVDYLLKPVSDARLRKALERAQKLRKKPLEIANDVARITAAALPNSAMSRKVVAGTEMNIICWMPMKFWRFRPKASSSPSSQPNNGFWPRNR
jgi:DNA-binding LytR/AlgR family response regulator